MPTNKIYLDISLLLGVYGKQREIFTSKQEKFADFLLR